MKDVTAIGLMSGTSMDGIDTAIIKTDGNNLTDYKFSISADYRKETLKMLSYFSKKFDFRHLDKSLIEEANTLITYDHFFAVDKILQKSSLKSDIIGFHGQTIYHNPEKGISIQLGDGNLLAKLTKTPVVFEFRKDDLLNNGQGAPLAPIFHKHVIKKLQIPLPCCFLNIGGVANITYFDKAELIGFDTGPGNGLIDLYMKNNFSKTFDYNGEYASKGKANFEIIKKLLNNKFFKKKFPKSLDKLSFYSIFNDEDFTKLNKYDAVSTLTELTIHSIIDAIDLLPKRPKTVVLMGGGKYNKYIVSSLKSNLSINVCLADDFSINGDMVEAQLMGYLAVRKLRNLPSTFPNTTGTLKPTICGTIFCP